MQPPSLLVPDVVPVPRLAEWHEFLEDNSYFAKSFIVPTGPKGIVVMSTTALSTGGMNFNIEHLYTPGMQGQLYPHWYDLEVSEYAETVLLNFRYLQYPRCISMYLSRCCLRAGAQ